MEFVKKTIFFFKYKNLWVIFSKFTKTHTNFVYCIDFLKRVKFYERNRKTY